MSHGASKYPISKLIARILTDSGLRRSEFVQSIGYRNTAKGLRRLDEWLNQGRGDEACIQRIASAYQSHAAELEQALDETEAIHEREQLEAFSEIEERERRRFIPFIWIHMEDGAHSFLMAVAEREIKVLEFQAGFERRSRSDQLEIVQRRVRKHYRKTGGRHDAFGAILRYRFADTFDTSIVLDIDGNVIEENGGRFLLPEVWLALH